MSKHSLPNPLHATSYPLGARPVSVAVCAGLTPSRPPAPSWHLYTLWGPTDLVSAGTGEMCKRYGFIKVDKHDDGTGSFQRIRKDSFYAYKKIIASIGAGLD